MKTILALIRQPRESDSFIQYLIDLARELGAGIHLLNVENPVNYPLGTSDLTGVAVANLQKSLDRKVMEAKEVLSHHVNSLNKDHTQEVPVQVSAKVGNEVTLIGQMVKEKKADMVALEYNQMSGFWQKDNVIRDLIRTIKCPVWVIPEGSSFTGMDHIVYATDYHEADVSTLKRLINLTRPLTPEIEALHITDHTDFSEKVRQKGFQEILETNTGYKQISLRTLVEHSGQDVTELVNSYASRTNTDLIVVLKENKNFLERIFRPSSSERMVEEANKPILVFHEQHRDG
jgi:nucleotide-binding universal stress UspA family protein